MGNSGNKEKVLMITGTNIDRMLMGKIRSSIGKDRDIQNLLRNGTAYVIWKPLLSLFLIIALVIVGAFNLVTGLKDALSKIMLTGARLSFVFIMIGLIKSIFSSINDVRELRLTTKKFLDSIKYIILGKLPRSPAELWCTHQASIMDAQIAVAVERLASTDASIIFGGIPYYDTIPIDSISIRWDTNSKVSDKSIRKHYKQFYRKFSQLYVLGYIQEKVFNSNMLQVSNCVFGFLFVSGYLFDFINHFDNKYDKKQGLLKKLNDGEKIHVVINREKISGREFNGKVYSKEQMAFIAESFVKYVTTPNWFTISFEKVKDAIATLTIDDIFLIGDFEGYWKSYKRDKDLKQEKFIRLPAKKFIAISLPEPDNSLTPRQPFCSILPGIIEQKKHLFQFALSLGGAEQNIALVDLVNKYRWSKQKGEKNRLEIGFAENAFEMVEDPEFPVTYNVGTEGYVYGKSRYIRAKSIFSKDGYFNPETSRLNNTAEVITFYINEMEFILICGYHALATKICTVKYIARRLYNSTDETIGSLIPSGYKDKGSDWKTYQVSISEAEREKLSIKDKPDWEALKYYWDKNDPLNQSKKDLLAILEDIEIK